MRIEAALKKRDRGRMRLRDLYSAATHHGATSESLNQGYAEIRRDLGAVPHWVISYLDGWRDALTEEIYRKHLAFGGYVDGRFYTTHSARPDYYQKQGIQPSDLHKVATRTGHYWVTTAEPRPFYLGGESN